MSQARWPQLFIVGAPRSGTTFLSAVVGAHSDVFVCDMKEPHFFGGPSERFSYAGPGDNWVNRTWITDEDEYLAQFAGRTERVLCDGSTNTLYWPEALNQIERREPASAYVCVLRDPVDRIESMFVRHRAQGLEPCASVLDAIRSEQDGERSDWSPGFRYLEQSLYNEHVVRFASLTGDRFLALTFDEVMAAPLVAAERVWELCGLGSENVDIPDSLNGTPHFRNPILRAMLVRPLAIRTIAARLAPPGLVARLKESRNRRIGGGQRLTTEERAFVLERVADDARRTEEVIGKSILRNVT